MEISVLGRVCVLTGSTPTSVGGLRQRTLLAILTTVGADGISIVRLVDEIWAGSPPEGAEPTVRTYITRLRRILDEDPLVPSLISGGRDGYRLDTTRVEIDRARFEGLVRDGLRLTAPAQASRKARLLRRALDNWHGPPFSDTSPGPLLVAEATRLEELVLRAAEEMARAELDCGRHREVIPDLERLVADQPWHEGLWSLLVLALYRSKRQAEALRTLQAFRDRLRQELGLAPSRDLLALEHAILVQEDSLDWRAAPEGAPSVTVTSVPVGVSQRSVSRPQQVTQALESGRSALARGAYREATKTFSRALAVLGEPTGLLDQQLACDMLLGTAEAELFDRNLEAARNASVAAADLARRMGSASRLGQAAVWCSWVNTVGREDPLVAALCDEALEALGESEPALRALIIAGQADYQGFGLGDGRRAVELSRRALLLAQESGDQRAVARCLFIHAEALGWTEKAGERLLLAEPLLRVARRSGNLRQEADGLHVRALARLALGDLAGFDDDRANLARTVESDRYWYSGVYIPLWEAMRRLMSCALDSVEPLVHELLAQATDEPNVQNLAAGQLFFLRREQGRIEELVPVIEQVAAAEPRLPAFRAGLALSRLEAGDPASAAFALEDVVADDLESIPRDLTWTTTLCLWAEVAAGLGAAGPARVLLAHLLPYQNQLAVLSKGLACDGSFDRFIGSLLRCVGDIDSALSHLHTAVEVDARLGAPALLARSHIELARTLLSAGGQRQKAEELLDLAGSDARRDRLPRVLQHVERVRQSS